METVRHDYAPKGVRFYYIYKALAHPETNGYVKPISLEERLMHVKEAELKLGSKIPWLCDSMDNATKHAMGNSPNSEFIIDADGKVVSRRSWSRPEELRADLAKLVGEVKPATQISDLDIKPIGRRPAAKAAGAKKLELPSSLQPLKIAGVESKEPCYVKLRVEAESGVTGNKSGKMYLGFRLDPLYPIHWNNLSGPLEYEIKAPEGMQITPAKGVGPKVDSETDAAPREFLVSVESGNQTAKGNLEITVRYFACHDSEGWCRAMTHTYTVELQADRDGGRSTSRGGSRGGRGQRGGQAMKGFAPGQRPGQRPGQPGGNRVMGMVSDVNVKTNRLTLRVRGGAPQTFVFTEKTVIMQRAAGGQKEMTVKELRPGDRVMLMPSADKVEGHSKIDRMMVMPR